MTQRVVALAFDGVDGAHDVSSRLGDSDMETLLFQLRQLGYQTINSKTFRVWQHGTGTLPERAVVLTFDQTPASHFDLVTLLHLRYRLSGTFFVTVEQVGRSGAMTWDQLRKLAFLGMEIGSRGMSPRPLSTLSPGALDEELARSKHLLEQQLGLPIRALAPQGRWNSTVAMAARRAGYDAVWVSTSGTNGRETNPQALRRVMVRHPVSVERLISLVEGWHQTFWWAANPAFVIRGMKRALGVYWYEQVKQRLVPHA